MGLDRRRNAFRADLADARLKGRVPAPRFAEGTVYHVAVPVAPVLAGPNDEAALDSEALWGETVTVFDTRNGFAWCQLARDGYVGYVPADALQAAAAFGGRAATHRVSALSTLRYAAPEATKRATGELAFGTVLVAHAIDGQWLRLSDPGERGTAGAGAGDAAGGGFVLRAHVVPIREHAPDIAATALRFLDVPYLFGGKSARGIDCSGLVQLALQAAGVECPRDTDMQASELPGDVALPDPETLPGLNRGDLIYWPGHVGIMIDEARLVHASGTPMCVCVEAVGDVARRSRGEGPVAVAVKRIA